jgi:hypothetical protein
MKQRKRNGKREERKKKRSTWWGMTVRIDGRQLNRRVQVSLCRSVRLLRDHLQQTWVPALGKLVRGEQQRERGKHVPAPGLPAHFCRAENPPPSTGDAQGKPFSACSQCFSALDCQIPARLSHFSSNQPSESPSAASRPGVAFAAGTPAHPSVTQVQGRSKQPCTCNPQLVCNASLQCTPSPVGLRVVDARTLGQHFRETESQTVSPPAPAPDSASCIAIGRMDSHTPDMSACHADG